MTSKKSLRPADRVSILKLRQSLKMARSAHAYVRGSVVALIGNHEVAYLEHCRKYANTAA